jgi:3D (Asp-Asp-Asp) domain-containing protein
LEKATGQSPESIRLTLIVALCVLSFVAGAAYTKADLWITMHYTPAIKIHMMDSPLITKHNKSVVSEQATPGELASLISLPSPNTNVTMPKSEVTQESPDEWQTIQMRVTAYCPCSKCCGQYADGMTACGHVIQPGDTFVAADKRYAFGTQMSVPGYNHGRAAKVLDRGGAIRGDRIDVFFHSHQEALEWGVRYLDVKVHTE